MTRLPASEYGSEQHGPVTVRKDVALAAHQAALANLAAFGVFLLVED